VYDLIDHSHRKWNTGLIKGTFEESVAEKILRLPLARLEHEDMLVWRGEPSGVFSAMWDCPVIVEMWNMLNLVWILSQPLLNTREWLTWVFHNGSVDSCRKICCAM
ncbi:hypothetical protein Gorai_008716, partial [Gossypium raimondii]|nr:hypothetical protein [Gossypium raimondii]